jgi:hypothetical protein
MRVRDLIEGEVLPVPRCSCPIKTGQRVAGVTLLATVSRVPMLNGLAKSSPVQPRKRLRFWLDTDEEGVAS